MASGLRTGKQRRPVSEEIASDVARDCLGDLINRTLYGSERFVLTRHGKPAAAIVSVADLKKIEAADAA